MRDAYPLGGPWTYESSNGVYNIHEIYEDDPPIAVVTTHGTEAHAKLIAAAPDLYDNCQKALDELLEIQEYGIKRVGDVIKRMRAALALARGEEEG